MQQLKAHTSIVIPFFGKWPLVMARLHELHLHAPNGCEIILINDCTPNNDFEGNVAWWQHNHRLNVRYLKNKENLGFGGSMNRGASKADGEVLVLLSDDVIVAGDFITPIINKLSVSPKTLIGGQIIDWPAGWNEFGVNGSKVVIPYLGGWMLACTKTAWGELGGFDPIFGKFDYEDVDLSTRALELGYELYSLNSGFLRHLSGVTVSSLGVDRQSITEKNRTVYIAKWKDRLPGIVVLKKEAIHE